MYRIDAWFSDGTFRTFSCDQRAASSIATRCAPVYEDLIEPFDPAAGIVLATSCFYKNDPGSIPGTPMSAAGNDDVMFANIIEPEMLDALVRLDVDGKTLFVAHKGTLQDLRRARELAERAGGAETLYGMLVQAANVAFAEIVADRALFGAAAFVETSANLLAVRDEVTAKLGVDAGFMLHCFAVHERLEGGKDPERRLRNIMQDSIHSAREAEELAAERAAEGTAEEDARDPGEASEGAWEAMAYDPAYGEDE